MRHIMIDESPDKNEKEHAKFEADFLRKKYLSYLKQAQNEKQMQSFLEANPILLPGLYNFHNGPLGDVVISQPSLGNEYRADFGFISTNSANSRVTLIEIESPSIAIFRNCDDRFTASFNKAVQQMRDWILWSQDHQKEIMNSFRDTYFNNVFRHQYVSTQVILIAGRRNEINRTVQREKRWAGLNKSMEPHVIMTYDRLADIIVMNYHLLKNLICRPKRYVMQTLRHIRF